MLIKTAVFPCLFSSCLLKSLRLKKAYPRFQNLCFFLTLDRRNEILIKNKRLLSIHGTKAVIAPSINLKKENCNARRNIRSFHLALLAGEIKPIE